MTTTDSPITTEAVKAVHNPYWDLFADLVAPPNPNSLWSSFSPQIGRPHHLNDGTFVSGIDHWMLRDRAVQTYSWTVTDPPSLQFVAEHCRGSVIDPFAGSGYWAYLLQQLGINVVASDIDPPGPGANSNIWHPDTVTWVPVAKAAAHEVLADTRPGMTMLLGWPPTGGTAVQALRAYHGDRVIFFGEMQSSMSADDPFYADERDWHLVGGHAPAQFFSSNDIIAVFDRNQQPGSP